jgi:lipoate-protein ligase A
MKTFNTRPWRVLFTGKRNGAYNMAVDAALLKSVEEGKSPPVLRLYAWEPYCVSLGYFQKPSLELDVDALRDRGWNFVLRPTGGRAVLHAEELTYSVMARRDEAPWCATLALSHERISKAWASALVGFHLNVSEGRAPQILLPESFRHSEVNLPCFASTSRAELAFGERKVVGSAQRRTREAFLQHGSIPLTREHERLVEVLLLGPVQRQSYLEALRHHAISLGEIALLPPDATEENGLRAWSFGLAKALLKSLGVSAQTPGESDELTPEEIETAQALEKTHLARQEAFFEPTKAL